MNNNAKHIIVEGPIGVGKSSLARKLAKSFGSQLLMEQPKSNPFLERFYANPERYALATQLSFLFQRAEQLSKLGWQKDQVGGQVGGLVSDFMFDKERLFAQLNLADDEYHLYQQTMNNLNFCPQHPDLIIYLQAPVDVLLERVKKRSVKYEMNMSRNYLEKLSVAYTQFFHTYDASPLLIVNAAKINPVDNESHYEALVAHLNRIEAGKHFFNPLADTA